MSSHQPETFVRTKLHAVRPPSGFVDRLKLETVRAEAANARLVTITAPGGFGKTTVAAAWLREWQKQGHHGIWLSLEQDDDEPARFFYCLTQALSGLGEGVGQDALALLNGTALTAPRAVASLLINDLEQTEGEIYLVLDDYQWIQNPVIHDAVAFLVAHAPDNFHVVITTRSAPPFSLARLRAHGEWLDVDVAALRFDEEETRRFLQTACTRSPSSEEIRNLCANTQGWAAALRIAALGNSGAGDALSLGAESVSGASQAFAHLMEDVLTSLSTATVLFMAQTSVLDRLQVDLCEAVTGLSDSPVLLDQLMYGHLLIEHIGSDNQWLRYHQLLLDYLRGPLSKRLKIDTVDLHRRAALWFSQKSMWTDAVRHAVAAGDGTQAIEWLAHCAMELVKKGDLITLLGWRRQFPPELLSPQPTVELAVAWGLALAMRYDETEPLLRSIEQSKGCDLGESERASLRAQCEAVRIVTVALQDDSSSALERVESWHNNGVTADAWTMNVMSNVLRFAHWKAGNWVGVYEQTWVSYSLEDDPRNVFSTVYREVLLGYVELDQARLGVAERHAVQALRLAEMHTGAQSVSAAMAAPLLAAIYFEQDRLDAAENCLLPLLGLIDNTAMLESVLSTYLVLARIAHTRGTVQQAYALLEKGESIGYLRNWDRLVSAMLVERLKWLAAEGRIDEANVCAVRLARLAGHSTVTPSCSRADLYFYRDWSQAHLALADERVDESIGRFSQLYAHARAAGKELRVMQLGTSLMLAYMARDDRSAAFGVLRDVLRIALRSGANHSILDQGADVRTWLSSFLISNFCEPDLVPCVQSLMPVRGKQDVGAIDHALQMLTERERRVLDLVAAGQSNKEVARTLLISAETVKSHLKSIFMKLGVQQRKQAAALARSLGVLRG